MALPPWMQRVVAIAAAGVGINVLDDDYVERKIRDSQREQDSYKPHQRVIGHMFDGVPPRPGFESPRPLSKRAKRRNRGKGVK